MKHGKFIILAYLLTQTLLSQTGWQQIAITEKIYSGMYFTTSLTGYAVGQKNLFKTTNGGYNWTNQIMDSIYLNTIYFINESTGFISASNVLSPYIGKILKTTNSGVNWYVCHTGSDYGFRRFDFQSQSQGIALATKSISGSVYCQILKTTNIGESWNIVSDMPGYLLSGVSFKDPNIGYVSGGRPNHQDIILKTTNGGANWNTMNGTPPPLVNFKVMNNNVISGITQTSFKYSTDAGINWSTILNSPNILSDVFFADSSSGYAIGYNGTIYKSINKGLNWYPQSSGTTSHLNVLFFPNSQTGYISGQTTSSIGILLKTTNGGGPVGINPISTEMPNAFSLSQNYPNPFNPITKIAFDIPNSGFTKLIVFDLLGREVSTIVSEELRAGQYEIDFDGSYLPSGIYYYRLVSGSFTQTKKMVLIK